MMMIILSLLFVRRNNHILGISETPRQKTSSPREPEGTKKYTVGVKEFQKVNFISKESRFSLLGGSAIGTNILF